VASQKIIIDFVWFYDV